MIAALTWKYLKIDKQSQHLRLQNHAILVSGSIKHASTMSLGTITQHLLDRNFSMSYLLGTEGEDSYLWKSRIISPGYVHFSGLEIFLSSEKRQGVDVLELCGGEAGVSRLAIRRRLNSGGNLDLVTGVDLSKLDRQKELSTYLSKFRPLVVVMAPPCTTFGGWSHLHRVRDPKASTRPYNKEKD